jgi:hypothetical protein
VYVLFAALRNECIHSCVDVDILLMLSLHFMHAEYPVICPSSTGFFGKAGQFALAHAPVQRSEHGHKSCSAMT